MSASQVHCYIFYLPIEAIYEINIENGLMLNFEELPAIR